MKNSEIAKQLLLTGVIGFIAALGLLVLPTEPRYLRAIYTGMLAIVLAGYLFIAKPRAGWVRRNLGFFSIAFALITFVAALGG